MTKICTGCNIEKPIEDFKLIVRRGKKVPFSKCNDCYKEYYKQLNKKSHEKNKVKRLAARKEYSEKNKDKRKEYDKQNRDKINEANRNRYTKDSVKYKERVKEYQNKNKSILREKRRNRETERRKTDELFRLKKNIRCLIRKGFNKLKTPKSAKTEQILGCTYEEFKSYIESKFEPWMNWSNYGLYNGEPLYGWDIDHIQPLKTAKTSEDVIRLNHHTNLQPLCSFYNRIIKG